MGRRTARKKMAGTPHGTKPWLQWLTHTFIGSINPIADRRGVEVGCAVACRLWRGHVVLLPMVNLARRLWHSLQNELQFVGHGLEDIVTQNA